MLDHIMDKITDLTEEERRKIYTARVYISIEAGSELFGIGGYYAEDPIER